MIFAKTIWHTAQILQTARFALSLSAKQGYFLMSSIQT